MEKVDLGRNNFQRVRAFPDPMNAGGVKRFPLKGDATCENLSLEIPEELRKPSRWRDDKHPFHLKIFHLNDLHGHVSYIDWTDNINIPIFSKIVSNVQEAREIIRDDAHAGVLFVSSGDDMIGSPFDVLVGTNPKNFQRHVAYHLFSKGGVDAVAIGNHDFDLGLDLLAHAVRIDANFPVLSANLKPTRQLKDICHPAAVIVIKGVRIGVIGLTTPAEPRSRHGSEYEIVDPIPVVKRLLPVVRSVSDIVVILSHLGNNLNSSSAPTVFAGDMELAQNLPFGSVELIIGGHTHDVMNESGLDPKNIVNGIPITQAGCNGKYLGEVDIIIRDKSEVVKIGLRRIEESPEDVGFEENYVQPLFKQVRSQLTTKLGVIENSQELLDDVCHNGAATYESALCNFVADGLVARSQAHAHPVDLAVVDATILNGILKPGEEFTYGDWMRVMCYANTLVLFTLTGVELVEFIRDNARRLDIPGESYEERGFLHFSKTLRYRVKLGNKRSEIQATDIQFEGIPIERLTDHTFRIACANFFRVLARRWERQTMNEMPLMIFYPEKAKGLDTGLFIRDLMIEHIHQHGGITREGGALHDGRLTIL